MNIAKKKQMYAWLYEAIADYVGENPGCTGRDIADALDMDPRDLQPRYSEMQKMGLLQRDGHGPVSRWHIPDEQAAA